MTRREFTENISKFILEMIEAGEQPILDYAMRSADEQKRLFDKGLSKCDGYDKPSPHQNGTAADLYLVVTNEHGHIEIQFEWDKDKSEKWHKVWELKYNGSPAISWDSPHFQGE